jgi:hypothetical protein
MRRELGCPENALVIHDIPSLTKPHCWTLEFGSKLHVVYFGNLQEYGPLIERALRVLDGSDRVRLEVFGANPLWKPGAADYFGSRGTYHEFIPLDELAEAVKQFQAVLVVMSFDPRLRRRMITSFPTKMIDAMQLRLPVIIWGPEYCSAITWARNGDRALCVTDPDPLMLRETLEELAVSPSEQQRLSKSASDAAAGDFNYERIQLQFLDALTRAIESRRCADASPV